MRSIDLSTAHRERQVELHNGRIVSNYSREWALECEARHLLKIPIEKRRALLLDRLPIRGRQSVEELKSMMQSIFNQQGAAMPYGKGKKPPKK